MYYVYIPKSQKHRKIYIGVSDNLKRRLKEHNNGQSEFTSHGIPWKLAYYDAYLSEDDAKARENQLKNYGSAFGFLKKRIRQSLNQS